MTLGKEDILILVEILSVFSIENDVTYGLVIDDFCYIEVVPFYAHSLESFYWEWVLNFVKKYGMLHEFVCQSFSVSFQF